jgi:hypothetical protein
LESVPSVAISLAFSTEVEENSYPWMAALGSRTEDGGIEWFCGGSLISRNMILTAAHCIQVTETLLGFSLKCKPFRNLGHSYLLI